MLFVKCFRPQKYKYKIVLQKKRKRLIQKGILNKAYLSGFHIHVLQISLDAFLYGRNKEIKQKCRRKENKSASKCLYTTV